jgi:signal peptidase II
MKYLLLLGAPLYVIDQITKWLVRENIPYGSEIPVFPGFFSLVHASNTGAAFSMLTGNNLFFVCLASGALLLIAYLLVRDWRGKSDRHRLNTITQIALALLASGILGNLTDRVLRGAVTDFLNFYYQGHYWPSFNVADSCICVAAGLMIIASLQKPRPTQVRAEK